MGIVWGLSDPLRRERGAAAWGADVDDQDAVAGMVLMTVALEMTFPWSTTTAAL